MENKKLINILLKDMGELEDLISEIKTKKEFDFLEIEFLHTRAKGILQLMQMLGNFESEAKKPAENKEEKVLVVEPVENQPASEKITAEEFKVPVIEKEPEITVKEPVSAEEVQVEVKLAETPKEPEIVIVDDKADEAIPEEETPVLLPESKIEKSDIELEEIKAESSHRLGDSFMKGRSLNDMVDDHNKLEFKLSNRPVSSIQAAIGINDRFQYIRELFDGSSEKYTSAVISLDSMNNINEAVSYLQHNFKWKKNETSLKFINLVKRRFANE